ncbi:MAG: hypothetical protein ACYC4N_02835 [Pirellulaceae bacterium]
MRWLSIVRTGVNACVLLGGFVVSLAGTASAADSPELRVRTGGDSPQVEILQDGVPLLHSPRQGLWSVAMDWRDRWPASWHYGAPTSVERVAEWTIVRGQVKTPQGNWEVSDSYRPEKGTIKCIRRFVWTGAAAADRCTLAIQFIAPTHGQQVVMPGILYHGNPSGAKSGRVPVYTGAVGEEALFEEHRFPMPFVSVEWQDQGPRLGAALHTLPCPAPFAHHSDQWWSLGCVAQEDGTELTLLSGPCAANGVRSSIKQRQGGFGPYDETYLAVPPNGIIEKTFYLQTYPVAREGSGFQVPTRTSLKIFEPLSLYGLPTFEEILRSKYRYSQTRWRDLGDVAGFRKFPDNGGPFFVVGWCGQAAAPGYALQVLGERLGAKDVDQQVMKSLNTVSRAKFYEGGFHTWYDYEKNEWSHEELLSQGQGMNNVANAIRVGRKRQVDTSQWESFLRHASDVHAARILDAKWSPQSTNEGFFIAPLCKAYHLFAEPSYLQAARKAADTYGARQVSMREPYWGGTLDASCEDKEGAYAALQGFLAVYEETQEDRYLQWAEHALDVVLTYVCVWDMDLPAGRLRNHVFNTRGWTAVSVQNMHVDAYGVLMTPEIYRMGELLQQEELKQLALVMFRSCGQIIDPYGSQGEQPQHTNYAQGGDLSDPANFRGGYHETWTVFWITAHFLNAGAQLQEMGVDLWR